MPVCMRIIRSIGSIAIFLLFAIPLLAQDITGKVVDADTHNPIAGVTIYLNGTYQGTSSNIEGDFIIHTSESHIPLIVSYVGYESQKMKVKV